MRTAKIFAVALIGVVLLGTSAWAQEAAPDKPDRPIRRARGEHLKNLFEKMVKELDLTAEQQKQVKQILDTHHRAVQNWLKENGEDLKALREQFQKARKEKDAETLKKLREKMAGITKERRKLQEAMHKQIGAVLTDEQKKKYEQSLRRGQRALLGMRAIRTALQGLKLSEKQEKQIRKMFAAARTAAAKLETPKEKADLWQRLINDIKEDVLTDKQKEKFEKALRRIRLRQRRRGLYSNLNLTDKQKEQMEKIEAKYREKIRNADSREERHKLIKKMREEMDSVLTDEQKAKAKKNRQERMKRWRERRDRRERQGKDSEQGRRRGRAGPKPEDEE